MFLFIRWLDAPNTKALFHVGVLWVALTLTFEFTFGHYVFGRAWVDLASDYNLAHGGLLAFGMVVLMLSPVIAGTDTKLGQFWPICRGFCA